MVWQEKELADKSDDLSLIPKTNMIDREPAPTGCSVTSPPVHSAMRTHTHIHTCTCIHVYTHSHIYICIHAYTRTSMRIYTHIQAQSN